MEKELFEEFEKCSVDPVYFICRWVKVIHPIRGLVPFELYPFQKKIVKYLLEERFNILRKFRQAGCTTLMCAFALWFTIFQSHKTVAILSKGDAESTEFLERVKIMYDELPKFLKPSIVEDNKHTLKFSNKSLLKSRASGKQAGRSLSGSLLIVDEAAFIETIDTIWAAAYPTISTGGKAVLLSTVNGMGNWFYEMYSQAIRGENDFTPIDIHWRQHPEYWRQEGYEHLYKEMLKRDPPLNIDDWENITRGNISHKEWLQEYCCEFLGTGDTFLEGDILRQLHENVNEDFSRKYNNRMYTWKDPAPMYEYIISVDPSMGRGMDYSAFHVINIYNGEQVAEFYSNTTPLDEFAKIIASEGVYYNTAFVFVERNSIGQYLIELLLDKYEYENLLSDETGEIGFLTTMKTREKVLALLEELIRTQRLKINSKRVVTELLTFIINPDTRKIEADKGFHDDLIMALALGAQAFNNIIETTPIERNVTNDVNKEMPLISQSTYFVKTSNGVKEEDIRWLLKN